MLIVYTFMYIFGVVLFEKIPIVTSTIILGIILGLKFIFNSGYRDIIISIIRKRKYIKIISMLIIIIIYAIFISTVLQKYEYSIVKTFINQLICINIGVLLFGLFKYKNKKNDIIKFIIYAFLMQGFIQISSFLIPSINEFFNNFRSQSVIVNGQWKYGGIRGLAVAGSNFYGLASAYGLIFIIYLKDISIIWNGKKILKLISLAILIFGGLSAGRTSIIGLVIGLLISGYSYIKNFFFYKKIAIKRLYNKNIFIKLMGGSLLVSLLVCVSSTYNISEIVKVKIKYFSNFAFEFIYNLFNGNGLTTTSTQSMFENMYFDVSTKTFLIGDGIYTSVDGLYYMNTDVGYMRNILFFGVIGFIMLIIYQFQFFVWNKYKYKYNLTIIIYLLILHLKGDIIGFLIITQSILILIFLCEDSKKRVLSGINLKDR